MTRASVHAELDAGARARAARRHRRRRRRVALRPDPGRAPHAGRARAAAGARLRGRAAAAPGRPARAQRDLRAEPQLPRRRHLAAPRAGDLRRDRAPQRVPDAGLGHAVLRPRPQPGLVRVHEPARRADRDGLRRPPRLQLGLRRRPRGPDGGAADRPLAGARARHDQPGAPRGDPHLLRRRRAVAARSRSSSSATTPRPAASTSTDLERRLSARTAAVLFDNPSFLGGIEPHAAEIAALARSHGAETIVGVDPISLGVLAPPSDYGADIVVGSTQPLGVHMSVRRRRRRLHRHARRPALRARVPDAAAQHLRDGRRRARLRDRALRADLVRQPRGGQRLDGQLGLPVGGRERRLHVADGAGGLRGARPADHRPQPLRGPAARRRSTACGSSSPTGFFKEFVVDFGGTGKTVAEVNRGLRERGIFGGKDLSRDFPELGQSALYCVTEVHTQADLDRLADAVAEVVA